MSFYNAALFDGIREEEYQRMLVCFQARTETFSPGKSLWRKGQIGVIEKGSAIVRRVDMEGNVAILEHLEENGVFGENLAFACMAGDEIQVVSETECRVLYLGYDHIMKRCENACPHHSVLVRNVLNLVAGKARRLSERVEVLSQRSIRGKLLCCFNLMAEAKGSDSFSLPFSLSGLAAYISTDRSAMMRELRHMMEEGLLEIEGRQVTLR